MFGMRLDRILLVIFVLILGIFSIRVQSLAYESDEDKDKPERLIIMAAEYPGVVIPPDKDEVNLDLKFTNKGRSDETVKVWIAEKPEDWRARIKTYQYTVMGVFVKSGGDKRLTFEVEPPKDVEPGEYEFHIKGKTVDARFKYDQKITITVEEGKKDEKTVKDATLTVSYPVLRGPSDAEFEFIIEARHYNLKLNKNTD